MFDYLKKLIFGAKTPQAKPLNLYQYKFVRYKEDRNEKYPLDLQAVCVPQMDGLVSVVLPVYNGGDILADSIRSVLCQTYENLELIIINDGSKDNTLEIAESFAKKDNRVRVLTQENKKIPRTLSRGFDEAKGEFLTWTSADNEMDKDFIEKMVADIKSKPNAGMIWANMRLIDAKGKKLTKHGWFEFPFGSGNVIFPNNSYELNTYANNTIGAAFMYRASAKEILGCYSSYKHTLEDYDYWMRMNSLLELKHTDFTEPVYSYRWHDGSLTAKDKELGITKNRYKLMALDDFRRDFYMMPLMWYITATEGRAREAEEFRKIAEKTGHIIVAKEDFQNLYFGSSCSSLCHISFGGKESEVNLPEDTVKICVNAENLGFDIYASTNISGAKVLEDGKKVYGFADLQNMFSYLDAKAKNDILYGLEGRIEEGDEPTKKLSVIICTHKMTDTLIPCLEAVCNQNVLPQDFELVFVSNSFKDMELKEAVQELKAKYSALDINYITAPMKGLSFARNAGLWAAKGEYVIYFDDDAIARPDVLAETIKAFESDEELGVVGGEVRVTVPDEAKALVNERTIGLWSDLRIEGDSFRYARDYGEFPYGANFAARRDSLRRIGGFRTGYGRVGNNFAGGEETLVSFMMEMIHQKVGLNPKSVVEHRIAADRFTLEHIEKTTYSGIMTQYRLRRDLYAPADWNDNNVLEREQRAKKLAAACEKDSADYVLYTATAKAFREVYENRQADYRYLTENKTS